MIAFRISFSITKTKLSIKKPFEIILIISNTRFDTLSKDNLHCNKPAPNEMSKTGRRN